MYKTGRFSVRTQNALVVEALKHRHVLKGEVAELEKLHSYTKEEWVQIELFLVLWKSDIVLSVALHLGDLDTKHVQMLVDCGRIRQEQLQDAFEGFLSCWSNLEKDVKNWEFWLPVRKRMQELTLVRDEDEGWYLFPKLQGLLLRHEGECQPGIFHSGPFASLAL